MAKPSKHSPHAHRCIQNSLPVQGALTEDPRHIHCQLSVWIRPPQWVQSRNKQNQGAGEGGPRADQSLESQSAHFPNQPWIPMLFRSSGQGPAKLPFCALHSARCYKDKRSPAALKEFNNFPKCNASQSAGSQSPASEPPGKFINNADARAHSQTEGITFFRNEAQELILSFLSWPNLTACENLVP